MSTKMPNKMLIDATHPEETRVVVVRGNRVEEFDFETAQRKQLRGNIYLAKVTRVEPSLQAAFIEYGGNRHGFLAFSEIHPDYYQIPVADRQALIEADERAHREAEEETESRSNRRRPRHRNSRRRGHGDRVRSEIVEGAGTDPLLPPSTSRPHPNSMKGLAKSSRHTQSRRAKTPPMPRTQSMSNMPARNTPARPKPSRSLRRSATNLMRMTMKARTPRKKSLNPSAATTCWKRCPNARSARAASTRSRKS